MFKIGITGGIGSGKTTVCKIFERLGVPVFYADDEAKILMNTDEKLIDEIKKNFGEKSFVNGKLNRTYLSQTVFADENKLKKINELVHAAVEKCFNTWCSNHIQQKYILMEAAVLFESGINKRLDSVVNVCAPEQLRIQRAIQRDGKNEDAVKAIIRNQLSDAERKKFSGYEILNDDVHLLIPQVLTLHEKFSGLFSSASHSPHS